MEQARDVITIIQILALPILGGIWRSILKIHRGNRLNGFKIESLVAALQHESKNGFMLVYDKKLQELKSDSNWIEDK